MPQRALKARVIIWRAPEGGPEWRPITQFLAIIVWRQPLTAPVESMAHPIHGRVHISHKRRPYLAWIRPNKSKLSLKWGPARVCSMRVDLSLKKLRERAYTNFIKVSENGVKLHPFYTRWSSTRRDCQILLVSETHPLAIFKFNSQN